MKKKFFRLKFGTVISVIVCLAFAVLLWLYVGFSQSEPTNAFLQFTRTFIGGLT